MTAAEDAAQPAQNVLQRAGLLEETVAAWLKSGGELSGDYWRDAENYSRQWRLGSELLAMLPKKPARSEAESEAAAFLLERDRKARELFLGAHIETIYRHLTKDLTEFKRVERLTVEAAEVLPGLVPDAVRLSQESGLKQKDKDGAEIDQGIFLAHVLANPACGTHLCHAMLLPHLQTLEHRRHYEETGAVSLEGANLERRGKAALVTMRNPRFLNAEDETTLDGLEIAIDLATLDPKTEVAILRGDTVQHPKYYSRRLFSAGINLTHLYHGKISYIWYIKRDLGLVNKLFRGLARTDVSPDETAGGTFEKPWIGAVEGFAIGGGCQILLVLDYVLAANDAYLT